MKVNFETAKLYSNRCYHFNFLVFIVHITDYDIGIRNENGNWIINTIIRVSH